VVAAVIGGKELVGVVGVAEDGVEVQHRVKARDGVEVGDCVEVRDGVEVRGVSIAWGRSANPSISNPSVDGLAI